MRRAVDMVASWPVVGTARTLERPVYAGLCLWSHRAVDGVVERT
jgi:hypothetical protein